MPALSLGFTSPAGALLGLLALVPLLVLALTGLRARRVARALGLEPEGARAALPVALAVAAVLVFAGLAAAQPVLRTTKVRTVRTASELTFVVDVSRSMAAAGAPGGQTRLERARRAVAQLRAGAPDVPAGLAGLTDRVLPYLFPTAAPGVFAETLRRSVAIQSPPPQVTATVATSFDALRALPSDGFFGPRARLRTCVVITDGESAPFSAAGVARTLGGAQGCRLVLVRIGTAGERVFREDGTPEANYRPAADAASSVERLAAAAGVRAYGEADLAAATAAVRRAAVAGPEGRATTVAGERPLAPWFAGAALLLTVGLALARLRLRYWRAGSPMYDAVPGA